MVTSNILVLLGLQRQYIPLGYEWPNRENMVVSIQTLSFTGENHLYSVTSRVGPHFEFVKAVDRNGSCFTFIGENASLE